MHKLSAKMIYFWFQNVMGIVSFYFVSMSERFKKKYHGVDINIYKILSLH